MESRDINRITDISPILEQNAKASVPQISAIMGKQAIHRSSGQ